MPAVAFLFLQSYEVMEKYSFIRKIFSWSKKIVFWEAEDKDTRAPAWAFRISNAEGEHAEAHLRAASCALQLRNHPSLLSIADVFSNDDDFCVVYEHPDSFVPLEQIKRLGGEYPLWVMRDAAEILSELHRRRLSGHFLGERAIFVNEENFHVRLGLVGLADVFHAHRAPPFGGNHTLDRFDDIRHLAQCFEKSLKQANVETVLPCLAEDKSARLDYPKLLQAMKQSAAFRPPYKDVISLRFPKNQSKDEAATFVEHLNLNDCHVSPWREAENRENRRDCDFQTKNFKGGFVNDKGDEHYYVPSFYRHSSQFPKGNVLRACFEYSEKSIRGTSDNHHHLAELGGQKDNALREWKLVPEKEKEFIEETAFQSQFCHVREMPGPVRKFVFLLSGDEAPVDRQKIQSLKDKQKHLDALLFQAAKSVRGQKEDVGVFDDFNEGRLVVCVKSDRDDLPKSGELSFDKPNLRMPFEFFWRDKRKIFFAVANNFEDAQTAQEQIDAVYRSGDAVSARVKSIPGELGEFVSARILPEIITRDSQTGMLQFAQGVLSENVGQETIPFKRQIDAVDEFEKGDMIEPSLGGILATPSAHHPLVLPPVQFDSSSLKQHSSLNRRLFNSKLNDSQKEAVKGAMFQKPLFLIQGPPGTGKTTVIVEIIRQMLADNPRARILVCSQTNLAVDNVLERLPDKKEKSHALVRKVRLARSKGIVASEVQHAWFDRLLKSWVADAINRSKQAMQITTGDLRKRGGAMAQAIADALEKSDGAKNEDAVNHIAKEWHAFLLDQGDRQQIRANVEGGWLPLEVALLKSRNVVGATCVHIAARRYREIFRDSYDCLIMDEAGKATPAESLIPILRAKQVVLIGDHKQLPPFVTAEKEVWKKVQGENGDMEDMGQEDMRRKFGKSLFEEMVAAFPEGAMRVMLNIQRRMPKQIGDLISRHFYEGLLRSPDDEAYAHDKRLNLPLKRQTSLIFIDTSKRKDRYDNGRARWRQNQCNADAVVEILRALDHRISEKLDFAVIAGYRGQVDLLRNQIRKEHRQQQFQRLSFPSSENPAAVVNTVDGFQGRENDIVIYDVVRSSSGGGSIGFLDEPRRLNVALSRAKKFLIIVGDADFLCGRAQPSEDRKNAAKPILGDIVDEIRSQGFIFNSLEEACNE